MSRYAALLSLLLPPLFATPLSFDAAVEHFREHNYDLHLAAQEAQKSHAALITAKERPNPLLLGSYEFMNINHNFDDKARGSNAQATVILSHPIETAGKRDRRIELAEGSIDYANILYDETVREQLQTLISAYYAVLSDQTDLANALENVKAYDDVVAVAKTKLDHGFLSLIDYQKISLQHIDLLREVENSRLSLSQDRETLAAMLALPSSDITVTAPADFAAPPPPLEALLAKSAERPDCKAARQNRILAEAALQLEKANALPNVNVGVEYASFGPYYEPLAGLNFSIPLPVYDRNEGDIEKSRIGTLQADKAYEKALRLARADIAQSYQTLQSRQTIYRAVFEGFGEAKDLKEKQEKIFALKGISVLELLDSQKNFREYQKNLTKAMIDLHIASARLKLSSGLDLLDSKGH